MRFKEILETFRKNVYADSVGSRILVLQDTLESLLSELADAEEIALAIEERNKEDWR